ncbi:hypothetical protein GJ744_003625 [Endocarpon pusillum]|uniref:Uncharacterized protein n=1 Tax=Endocarpon pusillum TaxID=364733 RepID=A0A8H7A9G1_9EURO|nr:hypothetical protein GJ744_003625 [Endocarpon pusillum]
MATPATALTSVHPSHRPGPHAIGEILTPDDDGMATPAITHASVHPSHRPGPHSNGGAPTSESRRNDNTCHCSRLCGFPVIDQGHIRTAEYLLRDRIYSRRTTSTCSIHNSVKAWWTTAQALQQQYNQHRPHTGPAVAD